MHRIEANASGDRHLRTLLTLGAVGQQTDAELLARFVAGPRGGDDAAELAFAALVDRHGATVLRAARTILGDEATALDAFQATFLILAQKARSLRVDDSLAPWLATVARRVALGARKARARRHRLEQAAARPEARAEDHPDTWSETLRAVLVEVDRLPEPYRSAVVACHLDGLTQRQAADRLRWPVGTLQSRLDRGRRKLRDRLTRQGLAPSALAVIPSSGLSVSLPPGLAKSLAHTATGWAIRSTFPLIAPDVLAIIQATTKEATMTKLMTTSFAMLTTAGLALTGTTLRTADGPGSVAARSPGAVPGATALSPHGEPIPRPGALVPITPAPDPNAASITPADHGLVTTAPKSIPGKASPPGEVPIRTAPPEPRPADIPPVAGPAGLTLLCFVDESKLPPYAGLDWDQLKAKNYPINTIPFDRAQYEITQHQVTQCPTYIVIDEKGKELARAEGHTTTRQVAELYNRHSIPGLPDKLTPADVLPPPGHGPGLATLLCFNDDASEERSPIMPMVTTLVTKGYPVRGLAIEKARDIADHYGVREALTFVLVDLAGQEVARTNGQLSIAELAAFYNQNRGRAAARAAADPIPPPADGPGLPTLLCFTANWSGPDRAMRPQLAQLSAEGYPVRVLDIDKAQDLSERYQVKAAPTYILINGSGVEIARMAGLVEVKQLADFYNQNRHKTTPTTMEADEPTLTIPTAYPRPWETVVRIKIHLSSQEWGFGSGTVIASTAAESIILTTAQILLDPRGKPPVSGRFTYPIAIDLFDGRLPESGPARLSCVTRDLVGEVVAIHFDRNFALIRIRPGRVLPAAPIAAGGWTATKGMDLISLGCSHGNDATAWDTQVLDPKVKMTRESGSFFAVKCSNQPAEGRSGGGLFTRAGYLVGITEFADPNEKVGLYTETRAFQDLNQCIDRLGNTVEFDLASLKHVIPGITLMAAAPLVTKEPEPAPSAEPIPAHPVSPQDQRLTDLERKLDRVLQSLDNIRGELGPKRPGGGVGP